MLIYALAHGPSPNLVTYQAYDINGYTFYTKAKDMDSDDQNSGVMMECMTSSDNSTTERFYERVEEIWELDYSGLHNTTMFRVRWLRMSKEKTGISLP